MISKINSDVTIRIAGEEDTEIILNFIKELADYEKLSHEVTADVALLKKNLFGDKKLPRF